MIQRIQTFYLVLISAIMLSMLFVPFANLNSEAGSYQLDATGLFTLAAEPQLLYGTWALFALIVLTVLLPLVAVFLYKRRMLQARFCIFNGILIVAFYLLFFSYWWILRKDLGVTTSFFSYLFLPLAALVLDYMAFRRILQDEILVRSLDRIR